MTENGTPLPLLSRYAIMIDVGYIYASTGELLFSASYRHEYRVDAADLIRALTREASEKIRGELLRVYWYDAARDRVPTFDQRVIAQMPLVKLRLGNLNARGQQKGVDAQIRADMEALARHRAITDAVLVAGDEDMVPAVEAAQAYGVRVHLWGVEPPYGTNQAERLVWESDTVHVLERGFLEPYFSKPEHPADSGQPTPVGPAAGPARPGPREGRDRRRARRAEVDTDPRRGQHQGPAARPDPAPGDRQGAAGGRGEGARPVAARLPGGPRVAARRVLGPGAPPVRPRRRPVEELTRMTISTPGMGSADYGSGPRLTVARGQPDAAEIAAVAAVLTALSRPARTADPHRTHRNPWSSPARRMREPLARSAGGWRDSRLPR
jgi:uncharacterized LabA/DUF88 family protein